MSERVLTIRLEDDTPFAEYHAELTAALSSAGSALSDVQTLAISDALRADERLKDARKFVDEASDLVGSLELEMQSMPPEQRNKLRPIVHRARDAVSHHLARVRTARAELGATEDAESRVRLLKAGNAADVEAMRERMRMADATADLEAATRSIADSRRAVSDTEMIGASILQDLQSQRATIAHARTNLTAVDAGIDQSTGILSAMRRRAIVNRIVVYVVGIAILLACVCLLFMRLFRRRAVIVHPPDEAGLTA